MEEELRQQLEAMRRQLEEGKKRGELISRENERMRTVVNQKEALAAEIDSNNRDL